MEGNTSKKRGGYSQCAEYRENECSTKKRPLLSQAMDEDKSCSNLSTPQETNLHFKNSTRNVKQVEKENITKSTCLYSDSSSDIEMISTTDLYKFSSRDCSPDSPGSDSTSTIPLVDAERERQETLIDLGTSEDETDDFPKLLNPSVENNCYELSCYEEKRYTCENSIVDEVKHSSSAEVECDKSAMQPNPNEQHCTSFEVSPDFNEIAIDNEQSSNTEAGDFAFIDLGGTPFSVSNDPVEPIPAFISMLPVKKHAVEQTAVQDSICTIDSTSASDDCSIFPDAAGSLKIATTNNSQETTNQFSRPNVTGEYVHPLKCLPSSSAVLEHISNEDSSFPSFSSLFAQDHPDVIPLNVTAEFLDKKEQEIRQAGRQINEIVATIDNERKRLNEKREFIKSKIAEQRADLAVRAKVIESMNQALTRNKEEMTRLIEKKTQLSASATMLSVKVIKATLTLSKLTQKICENKLKAIGDDTNADSLSLIIAEDEEKANTLGADIARYSQREKTEKESLVLTGNCLAKCAKKCEALQLEVNEMEAQHKRAEALVFENSNCLEAATNMLSQITNQRKLYSAKFFYLKRIALEIMTCRKKRKLDRQIESLLGKEVMKQIRESSVAANAPSNVQLANQVTVIEGNYQPNMMQISNQPTIVNDRSSVHFTSLQSFTIHNHAPGWNPQPYMPLPPRFPSNFLQTSSVESTLLEAHPKQLP